MLIHQLGQLSGNSGELQCVPKWNVLHSVVVEFATTECPTLS